MSMTKQQFFDELAETLAPTEAQLQEQYYYEMARRRQLYIDHITEQVMAQPESHWFSADYEAWMNQETARMTAELFIAKRNAGKTTTDMDFDIPIDVEDSNHQKRNEELDNLFF